jgi:hypothetical protein
LHSAFGGFKMKKVLWVGVIIAVVIGAGFFYYIYFSGPTAEEFASLREPRLTRMDDAKVIQIEISGDPNKVGQDVFGALFSGYYRLSNIDRRKLVAPRARWPKGLETAKQDWIGRYALPVPADVGELPAGVDRRLSIATWHYGDVAEILHVGPYSAEQPTIARLHQFIAAQGLEIVGDHEEEYIMGPKIFGLGSPSRYLTIIRYPVRKK